MAKKRVYREIGTLNLEGEYFHLKSKNGDILVKIEGHKEEHGIFYVSIKILEPEIDDEITVENNIENGQVL